MSDDKCARCGSPPHRQMYGRPGHNDTACINTLNGRIATLRAAVTYARTMPYLCACLDLPRSKRFKVGYEALCEFHQTMQAALEGGAQDD